MKTKRFKIAPHIFTLAILLISTTYSFAQADTSGMTQEEKEAEMRYQESVRTDADRRIEIPFTFLPESIHQDIQNRYTNPIKIKAWRWVDEESILLGYEILLGTENREVTMRYNKKGVEISAEEMDDLKQNSNRKR